VSRSSSDCIKTQKAKKLRIITANVNWYCEILDFTINQLKFAQGVKIQLIFYFTLALPISFPKKISQLILRYFFTYFIYFIYFIFQSLILITDQGVWIRSNFTTNQNITHFTTTFDPPLQPQTTHLFSNPFFYFKIFFISYTLIYSLVYFLHRSFCLNDNFNFQ